MSSAGNYNSFFHHISLKTNKYREDLAFYEAMGCPVFLDWIEDGYPCCFIDMGNGPFLELHGCGEEKIISSDIHICVHVDDVSAYYEKALQNGATPYLYKPFDAPLHCTNGNVIDAKVAFVRAPAGEAIEIIEWKNFDPNDYKEFFAANQQKGEQK